MESTEKKSTLIYWLIFFLSIAAFFFLLKFKGEYITVMIPFICYSFVKGLDII